MHQQHRHGKVTWDGRMWKGERGADDCSLPCFLHYAGFSLSFSPQPIYPVYTQNVREAIRSIQIGRSEYKGYLFKRLKEEKTNVTH